MKTKREDTMFHRARRSLLLDHCFFGSLIMHLQEKADTSAKHGVWVDGVTIGYNAETLEALQLNEAAGLLAKSVMQCALSHHVRRGDRDVKLWNDASDYVINPEIIDSGLPLPKGALVDPKYRGMSVEQAYAALEAEKQKQQQQQKPQGGDGGQKPQQGGNDQQQGKGGQSPGQGGQQSPQDKGTGSESQQGKGRGNASQSQQDGAGDASGEVRDMPGEVDGEAASDAQQGQQEREWKVIMQQALQSAKNRGDLPGNMRSLIEAALQPVVSWRDQLRQWMLAQARDDLSWARPNRRFIGSGLYLPAVHSERMGRLVIGNDTSGSTAGAQAAFLGEMRAIVEDVNPEHTLYLQCDTRVCGEYEIEPGDDLPAGIAGLGGTDLRALFQRVEQCDEEPQGMIILTDLETPFPTEEPPYPVLWVSVNKSLRGPFGDTIYIDPTQR